MRKLLLLLVLMMLPLVATAFTGEAEIDGIKYFIITKGQTAEVRHKKYSGDIVIPSSIVYEGVNCSVVSIGERAFYECWKSRARLTPEGKAALTPENLLFLTPVKS